MNDKEEVIKTLVEDLAKEHGFLTCGFASLEPFDEEEGRLKEAISSGLHGEMAYLERNMDLRINPKNIHPGAETAIIFLTSYYPSKVQDDDHPKIAKYAYGDDYHWIVKQKMNAILKRLQQDFPEVEGRSFVDSAPILERQLAVRAGLVWRGKNGLCISPKHGSFFFISELFINQKIPSNREPLESRCGTCQECIKKCPTRAIIRPQCVDARKCISYLTIEKKTPFQESEASKVDQYLFGCDICQDVCPWNRGSTAQKVPIFASDKPWFGFTIYEWRKLSKEDFNNYFRSSAIKRTGYERLMRNIEAIDKNKQMEDRFVIENDHLKVEVLKKGAELCRLYHKKEGRDYLWDANPEYWGKSSPVLFPIVGSVKDDTFRYKGKSYSLPRHGFAREKAFKVEESSSSHIIFRLEYDQESLQVYPFKFGLKIHYTLQEANLKVSYTVENLDSKEMLFSIGAHPAFALPTDENIRIQDYEIEFEQEEIFTSYTLNKEGLITDHSRKAFDSKSIRLTRDMFCKDALIFEGLKSTSLVLRNDKTGYELKFMFGGFPYFALWNKPGAGFICLEPWFGIADGESFSGELDQKKGIQILDKEEVWAASLMINFNQ